MVLCFKKRSRVVRRNWGSVVSWFYRVVGGLDVRSVNEVSVTVPQTQLVTNYTCGDRHITVVWQRNEAKGTLTIHNVGFVGKIRVPEGEIPLQQGDNEVAFQTNKK